MTPDLLTRLETLAIDEPEVAALIARNRKLESENKRHIQRLEMLEVAIEDATGENAQLRGAMKDAVHIFERDGEGSQAAWNMRAVLSSALKGSKP